MSSCTLVQTIATIAPHRVTLPSVKFTKANGSCQILKGTGEEARSAVAACGDQAVTAAACPRGLSGKEDERAKTKKKTVETSPRCPRQADPTSWSNGIDRVAVTCESRPTARWP